ncbi:pentapeptide repeat-containing protein [Streptomyces sp. ID05-18]|uniref:pentapeptide repeat-containing protein n=1 Tax=Streptomyces sp. ID05-18 TaxID=3028662 RepID=UPI0029A3EE72|nr:pentapeptide repeat-containing protein [Streptomyces sp. ID05-18]MDX3490973.1 pentapeptide repeat-containing protein [Streptomyces sp. ID05-18]
MRILRRRSPEQQGRHTPNLWPVWLVAPVSLILVALLAYGLYHGVDAFLTAENPGKKPVSGQDNIKVTVTALTLVGAVLAGLYAYRKQLLDEGSSHRADAMQLAERYTKAAEQLGHEQAAVRLAGVYAMARLADDWQEQRQVCVNVLCAYLRMPYETDTGSEGYMKGEREVRLTIIRTIRDHLQDPTSATSWCGRDLDFTGAVLDGGDFENAKFTGGLVTFTRAKFTGGLVTFTHADFTGGTVDFNGADFTGGTVDFSRARFTGGTVDFSRARFTGGTVDFSVTDFSGGIVAFNQARFSGGTVDFRDAKFFSGMVLFHFAALDGGRVTFDGAQLSGSTVSFFGAILSDGMVALENVLISDGALRLDNVLISDGTVSFIGAALSGGTVTFADTTLSGGTLDFENTTLADGTLTFDGATLPGSGTTVDANNILIHAACAIEWGPLPTIPVNQP